MTGFERAAEAANHTLARLRRKNRPPGPALYPNAQYRLGLMIVEWIVEEARQSMPALATHFISRQLFLAVQTQASPFFNLTRNSRVGLFEKTSALKKRTCAGSHFLPELAVEMNIQSLSFEVSDHEVEERSAIVQRPLVPHKTYGELLFAQSFVSSGALERKLIYLTLARRSGQGKVRFRPRDQRPERRA